MNLLVVSDTHIRPGSSRRLPDELYRLADTADVILHAGDVVVKEVLDELAGFAPVHAVLGNNDDAELAGLLPERRVEDYGGVRVGMVHDSGPRTGRAGRMKRLFPDCVVVVFGHSHIPADEVGVDGQRLFNPGSPTDKRRQPDFTVGLLELADGDVRRHEIVVLG